MERKFKAVRDISHILHTLETTSIITNSQMTNQQKILAHFQRANVIQDADASDQSDYIDDFFYIKSDEEKDETCLEWLDGNYRSVCGEREDKKT
jgi:hypothetical protein